MPPNEERLYIKVVLPNQAEDKKVHPGGTAPKPFKTVTPALREQLVRRIGVAEEAMRHLPQGVGAIPLVVDLDKRALAKTHRPENLFCPKTCPIIGAGKPGQLFAKGTKSGLKALRIRVGRARSGKRLLKDISTVHNLRPVVPADRLSGKSAQDLFTAAPKVKDRASIKVSLFAYDDSREDNASRSSFEGLLQQGQLTYTKLAQFTDQDVYRVMCRSEEDVEALSNYVMVRSVSQLPVFRSLVRKQFNFQKAPNDLPGIDDSPLEYPVVAVVDSGIAQDNPRLDEWVAGRERYVSRAEENNDHGTFVAGLVIWGDRLNADHPEIGTFPCRLLDVHVLPNSDPSHGPVGFVSEAELLQSLEECLRKHANEVKVWNLSLGSNERCRLDRFSDFAIELDNLQEKFSVSFVIAAGNYVDPPLLPYPRPSAQADQGRITTPADSVLGVTVGAISQLNHPSPDASRRGEPSPFSCNGPGPNYIIKPDLAHFGGNISLQAKNPLGLTSLTTGQRTSEDIGTSFATPLISRQLAHIYHSVTPAPSPTLARALLTHNARDIRTGERVEDGDDHFIGFGTPLHLDRLIECTPWMTTLVFDEYLRPGYILEWDDFPYPESLIKSGKYHGEMWMTLAYPPKRDPRWGSEYCETHIDASFGVFRGDTEESYTPQCPPEHSNKGDLYESFQVRNLRKWAPVRTYHRRIKRGLAGNRWRLSVRLLCRHNVEQAALSRQPFTLILSIADPERGAPVYDEMAQRPGAQACVKR